MHVDGVPATEARRQAAPAATFRQDVEVRVEHRQRSILQLPCGVGKGVRCV